MFYIYFYNEIKKRIYKIKKRIYKIKKRIYKIKILYIYINVIK